MYLKLKPTSLHLQEFILNSKKLNLSSNSSFTFYGAPLANGENRETGDQAIKFGIPVLPRNCKKVFCSANATDLIFRIGKALNNYFKPGDLP